MNFPRWQDFSLSILKTAADGTPRRRQDFQDPVADEMGISHEERQALTRGGTNTKLADRVDWAAWHLRKAGLLSDVNGRGTFTITGRGREALAANPPIIDVNFMLRYPDFEEYWTGGAARFSSSENEPGENASTVDSGETPIEKITSAYLQLEDRLREDLLDAVKKQTPTFFEKTVLELLRAMGYGGEGANKHTGGPGDGGIDGVVTEDALGLDVIYVQAKRYANPVPSSDIRDFIGSLHMRHARKGVFITTSTFPRDADHSVSNLPEKVVLIDGRRFSQLCIEHGVGVADEKIFRVKKLDVGFFAEEV